MFVYYRQPFSSLEGRIKKFGNTGDSMNKNMIAFIILSIVIVSLWSEFMAPKQPPRKQETVSIQKESKPVIAPQQAIPLFNGPAPVTANPTTTGKLYSDLIMLDYSSSQGAVINTTLTDKKYLDKKVNILDAMPKSAHFPSISSVFAKEPAYKLSKSDKNFAEFVYEQDGLTEIKKIELKENYTLFVTKTIINRSGAPLNYKPELFYNSIYENEKVFNSYGKKFNIMLNLSGEMHPEISDTEALQKALSLKQSVKWAGVDYGFFLFSILNPDNNNLTITGKVESGKNLVELNASYPAETIAPGFMKSYTFKLYFGPKELVKLEKAGSGLDAAISFGMFSFLATPMLSLLNFFFNYVSNYGIAIILLTILVKTLLWPLSAASFKSMNKMKKLQPKVNSLKEKYKTDKETLNKEIMMMYKTEGVNPFGGCLPILIQMPVYIALYSMINNAVELYNAPFLTFWLTDLSTKDPYYILPVSLGIFMFLQQKMMPQQMDNPQQKMMLYMMPLMFAGFMLFLPSGLNLYILASTIIGILQQLWANKKYA